MLGNAKDQAYWGIDCLSDCAKQCGHGQCIRNKNTNKQECQCYDNYYGDKCQNRRGIVGCWRINQGGICFAFDKMNRKQKVLKAGLVIGEDDYLLVEDVASQLKDYNLNQLKLHGRVYVKRKDTFIIQDKVFKAKVDDDVLSLDIIDSRPGQLKLQLGGVRNRECDNKKDCFGNGIC